MWWTHPLDFGQCSHSFSWNYQRKHNIGDQLLDSFTYHVMTNEKNILENITYQNAHSNGGTGWLSWNVLDLFKGWISVEMNVDELVQGQYAMCKICHKSPDASFAWWWKVLQ